MTQQNNLDLPQNAKTTTRTSIQRAHTITITLTRTTLLALLCGKPYDVVSVIPPLNAEVTVLVPGEDEWSNTELDIDEETTIQITWTEVEELLA